MALIDKASLLMVPSTYEDGTLYNILPSGNKAPDETGNHNGYDQTRADFTFSRGANLAATRVNAAGLIEKGRENLLLVSNTFDSGVWANDDTTETSGQEGYDGTNNAWKLVGNTNASRHHIVQSKSEGGINAWSLYAKASGHNYVQFGSGSTVHQYVNFDLSDGSIGDIGSDFFSANAEDVGNGWYRLSVVDKGSTNGFYISLVSSKTAGWLESWTMPNATDGIFIQSAQLEKGLVATDYIETTTTTAKAGVLENMPRIDYSSGAGALLLEPLRTNLITHSEALSIGTSGSSVTQNTSETTSPEGVYNATKVLGSTTYLAKGVGSAFSGNNTTSVFLKKGNDSTIGVYMYDGAYYRATFNLETGTIDSEVNATATIENYGNGWYRCSIYKQTPANVVEIGIDSVVGYCYTYGWQHEYNASYASSYIPTMGTSASRAADSCENATASTNIFGASKGAFYIEGYVNTLDTNGIIPFTAGTGTSALMYVWIRTNGTLYVEWYESGVLQAQLNTTSGALSVGDSFKIAAAYQNNDFVAYLNGAQVETDTSGTAPNPTSLKLGQYTSGAYKGGALSKVYVFNERLSNTELATLTA